jgi:hypothetical protein
VVRWAGAIVREADRLTDPQPQPRLFLLVAAAILHLAAGAPSGGDVTAAALLARVRDDIDPVRDVPSLGGWAIAGALLARQRGDDALAGELWALGSRMGAAVTTMFAPAAFAGLTAPLGPAGAPGPGAGARIVELMAVLLDQCCPASRGDGFRAAGGPAPGRSGRDRGR